MTESEPQRRRSWPPSRSARLGEQHPLTLVLIALALLVAALLAGLTPVHNPDIGLHLATGRWVAENLAAPSTDPFSFTTSGRPWVAFEWASGTILHLSHGLLGWNGLIALKLLLILATLFALVDLGRREGASITWTACLLIFALPVAADRLTVRPHLFGYLLIALSLNGARRLMDGDKRWRFLLPLLCVLWTNLHGSFVLAPALVGCYALEAMLRREPGWKGMVLTTVAVFLATFVSPYGVHGWLVPLAHVGDPIFKQAITEWGPAPADELSPVTVAHPIWLLITALSFVAGGCLAHIRRLGPFLVLAGLSLGAVRFVAPLLLLCAPVLAANIAKRLAEQKRAPSSGVRVVVAFSLALLTIPLVAAQVPGWPGYGVGRQSQGTPEAAARFIRQHHLQGRIFNAFDDGDYLIGALYPDFQVYIDGRLDLHGSRALLHYAGDLLHNPDSLHAALERHQVNVALLPYRDPNYAASARQLDNSEQWALMWLDARYAVYLRTSIVAEQKDLPPPFRALRAEADPLSLIGTQAAMRDTEIRRLLKSPGAEALGHWLQGYLRLQAAGMPAEGVVKTPSASLQAAAKASLDDLKVAHDALADVPTVGLLYAVALGLTGELDEAVELVDQLLDRYPQSPAAMVARLELRLYRGDAGAAEEAAALLAATSGSPHPWLEHLREALSP